jgi:hypothetical protein
MQSTLIILLLVIAVVVAAVFFFWNSSQTGNEVGVPTSSLLVHIMAPASGMSVNQGTSILNFAQAWSPNPLADMELWMDRKMVSAENVSSQTAPVGFSWELEVHYVPIP